VGEIESTFELLRDNPRIGHSRSEHGAGLFSFPTGHHVVYYRIRPNTIRVVRILHERADPTRHL
jgi:toxin ParE1/3/4